MKQVLRRLLIHVEGVAEETFVNEVIGPHLYECGFVSVGARLLGNARLRLRRGGIRPWGNVKSDIVAHLRQDEGCLATTMIDYYGMPSSGNHAWPGRSEATALPFPHKAEAIESAIHSDICNEIGGGFEGNRFVPYVMMHEFEAMLFSDCEKFGLGISRPDLIPQFRAIRDLFESPEEINDSPATAPSRRIEALVRNYQKPLYGVNAALEIGLERIREECPHFNSWLTLLEEQITNS